MALAETIVNQNHPEDLIRVKNPTNQDFTFFWDSLPHVVRAGQEETFPRYLAVQYAKKMVVTLVNAKSRRVREAGTWRDTLRVDDPKIQRELIPHILLYVVKPFVESPPPAKMRGEAGEFDIEEYRVAQEKRKSDLEIDIPAGEEQKIFGLEPPKGEDEESPKAGKKKEFTLEELQDEARANGHEVTGKETKKELEEVIISAGGGKPPEEEEEETEEE